MIIELPEPILERGWFDDESVAAKTLEVFLKLKLWPVEVVTIAFNRTTLRLRIDQNKNEIKNPQETKVLK